MTLRWLSASVIFVAVVGVTLSFVAVFGQNIQTAPYKRQFLDEKPEYTRYMVTVTGSSGTPCQLLFRQEKGFVAMIEGTDCPAMEVSKK